MTGLLLVSILVLSYLLGSIPMGLIIAWLKTGGDLRATGSGKTGATNVMRSAGRGLGFLTLFLDGLKAAIAVLVASLLWPYAVRHIGGSSITVPMMQGLAGLAAIFGHNRPLFAGFRGGRGVSSFFGSMCMIHLPAALLGIEVLAAVALISRFMSLGSIVGGLTTCVVMAILYWTGWVPWPHLAYSLLAVGILTIEHRDNIGRLRNGTERKLF